MTKINSVESVFEDFAVLVKIKCLTYNRHLESNLAIYWLVYFFTDPTAVMISDNVTESVETIGGRERIKLRFEWQVCFLSFLDINHSRYTNTRGIKRGKTLKFLSSVTIL